MDKKLIFFGKCIKNNKSKIFLVLMVIVVLGMGIGYASIDNITSEITGEITAQVDDALFISEVSKMDGDESESIVSSYVKTVMTGKIVLSSSDGDSSITYMVTVYNNTNLSYIYKETVYSEDFYDNEDIIYTVDNFTKNGTVIDESDSQVSVAPGESLSFEITFYYKDNTTIDNNILNYTIYFKFSSYSAVDVVLSLVDGQSSSSTDVITLDNTTGDSCTYTLAYDGTTDNNLRYVGSNPCNYVSFNDETWRIIGVINNVDDGNGNKETRIKLVRTTSAGNYSLDYKGYGLGTRTYSGTYYGSNDWSDSQLMMFLNTSTGYTLPSSSYSRSDDGEVTYSDGTNTYIIYKEGCAPAKVGTSTDFSCTSASFTLNETAKSLISDAVWNLGGRSDANASSNTFYTIERGTAIYTGHAISWIGKVGLIYPSDYGYATSGGSTTRSTCLNYNLYNWNGYSDCYKNDWLYPGTSTNIWTITSGSSYDRAVFVVYYNGKISWAYASKEKYDGGYTSMKNSDVFPTLYLSSDVIITDGDGTSISPYQLSLS